MGFSFGRTLKCCSPYSFGVGEETMGPTANGYGVYQIGEV
jgi:hypothetical protein